MKISERWLREWADPPGGTEDLVRQLTMQGLEVDASRPASARLDNVVVARVVSVEAHPGGDRLRICQVDDGMRRVQVVCGAANVAAGGVYPLALEGAVLPGPKAIKATEVRGVQSAGMLCSALDLGLADDAQGLLELPPDMESGTAITQALGLDDFILDINLTPNRADCYSVVGIARDLAAVTGLKFAEPEVPAAPVKIDQVLPVTVTDEAGCQSFAGRVVRGVQIEARTPLWLAERLRRSGLRTVNVVVDVSNYVMLELGQPMHAYDLAQLRGHIDVRQARRGERVKLLTGTEVSLDADTLVIADASGAIGIAGVMGGATTSVSQATRDVFLESAFFSPGAIAGRARRHGLQTDASIRFERGVDPSGQLRAVERATSLLLQIAGGAAGPCQHFVTRDRPPPAGIHLREKQIGRILGTTFPATEVEAVLRRLGMQVRPVGGGWTVTPPPHRFDVAIEADLLEEIARVTGYERIPEIAGLQAAVLGSCSESAISGERVSDALVDRGYQEVITYSFTEAGLDGMLAGEGPKAITLVNPISADLGTLRRTMWPGLVRTALHNQARQQARIRCFEKGVVYHASGKDVTERAVVAGMAVGAVVPEQWDVTAAPADFFDVKADIEAMLSMGGLNEATEFLADVHPALQPGRTARIRRDGADIGWLGNLHPALVARLDLVGAPVLFEIQLSAVQRAMAPAYAGLSRYPSVRRDVSLVMDRSVPASAILSSIARVAGPALRETIIFDVYAGGRLDAGKKSIALGLILQQTSRTLTDAETDQIIGTIIRTLAADLGAEIRA